MTLLGNYMSLKVCYTLCGCVNGATRCGGLVGCCGASGHPWLAVVLARCAFFHRVFNWWRARRGRLGTGLHLYSHSFVQCWEGDQIRGVCLFEVTQCEESHE